MWPIEIVKGIHHLKPSMCADTEHQCVPGLLGFLVLCFML